MLCGLSRKRGGMTNTDPRECDYGENSESCETPGIDDAGQALKLCLLKAPLAVVEWDGNLRVIGWNQAAEEVFGYAAHEAIGRDIRFIFLPETTDAVTVISTGLSPDRAGATTGNLRKDGRSIICSWYCMPVVGKDGKPAGAAAFCLDVTETRKVEETMRMDEARLESLFKIAGYRAETIKGFLDYGLDEAIGLTLSRIGYIFFYDEAKERFTLNAWSRNAMEECAIRDPDEVYELSRTGLWGEVVRQRRPVLVNDFEGPHPLKRGYPEGHVKIYRYLSVPVFSGNSIVAVVGVANKESDYDQSDVRQLTLLMDSIWKFAELRRADEKIKKAAAEWRTTFDSINDLITVMDRDFRIVRANRALSSYLGMQSGAIPGRHCFELMHHREDPVHFCPLTRMYETKRREETEAYFESDDRWVNISVDPVLDDEKNVVGAIHVVKDITDRKKVEKALRESEKRYRGLFEHANEAIFVTHDSLIVDCNAKTVEMLGCATGEILGRSVHDFSPTVQPDGSQSRECLAERMESASSGNAQSFEWRFRRVDGSLLDGDAGLSGIVFKYQVFVLFTVRDITRRKQAEELVNKMMSELEAKNRELENTYAALTASQRHLIQQEKMASIGQLAAGVAHEINNPVGFIMSNINTMGKFVDRLYQFIDVQAEALRVLSKHGEEAGRLAKEVEEKAHHLKIDYILGDMKNIVQESLDGTNRVKRIVQDLKSFSRLDEAEQKLGDINGGLESTINVVWNELKYKAVVNKEYGRIPLTKCNLGQLNQVFMNLLVNAAQAIEQQGTITVKTGQTDGSIVVSISDTGCGIPEDKIDRIFEPFFTTKEIGKGTGLGLSIAYDIVKKHGGAISVTSETGRGTTFTVSIPVVEH